MKMKINLLAICLALAGMGVAFPETARAAGDDSRPRGNWWWTANRS
ncbi:MAG: hypothetical protein ACLQVY_29800 [Limisphaerales bacterium]